MHAEYEIDKLYLTVALRQGTPYERTQHCTLNFCKHMYISYSSLFLGLNKVIAQFNIYLPPVSMCLIL